MAHRNAHCRRAARATARTTPISARPGLRVTLCLLLIAVAAFYAALVKASPDPGMRVAGTDLTPRNLQFARLQQQHGLSQGGVNAIVQDRQGYIWLGTQEGLNRYDGYEMHVYEHRRDDGSSLSHDWVWSLLVDVGGTLWIGTDGGGLNRYDREQDSFTQFRHVPGDANSLSNDRVRVVYQDSRGAYWVGTDGGGLNLFDEATGQFRHYLNEPDKPDSLPGNTVLTIFEDSRGKLWIGTDQGLARMDHAGKTFTVYRHDPADPGSISNNKVRAIHEDRRGQLWVGTYEGGLNRFDRARESFVRFRHDPAAPHSLSHDRVRDLYEDRQGTLWVATDNGLNEWRPDPGAFVRYGHDPEQPGSLSDDRLTTLFQDSGGVLWVGTLNGANRWNYLSDAFAYLQVQPGEHSTISGNVITAMAESSEGAVWIATYGGGLNRVDLATASIRHFRNIPGDEQSLSDDRVMALYIGEQDEVWVGTRKGGLNLLDPRSGKVTRFRHEPGLENGLSSDSVTAVLGDRAGNIWVGTYGAGLNRLDPASGEFTSYRHDSRDPRSLSSDRVLDLFSDSDGTLWVGTEDGGLNRFDPKTESFTAYRHDPNDPLSLGSDAAWNVMESRDGSLWISTLGGGLNRWTAAARSADVPEFDQYRKGGGLKSDTVFGVLEDQDGFLWLSTNRGLTRLNPENGLARHFDRFNGLRGDEFNFGAYLKTRSGQLWFGGSEGLVTFNPDMLLVNTNQPDIVLSAHTRLEHLATAYSNEQQVPEPIVLGYDDEHISFSFAALDYASPDKNQYRYRLEGFDDEWVDPGQLRTATYTSLPAGDYEFRVKASNNDGIWNEQGASLRLHVEPPPWQTPLAYSFYTLLLGGTVINYRRTQNKKLDRAAKHSAKLEREVQARTRELASRNDELKALNEKLLQASVTDSLTGLKNRRYLYESIGSEVALIERRIEDRRNPGTESKTVELTPSLFFMMIDLDGFKTINDSYGHLAGDQALLQVRDVLQSTCRKSDIIIRWGGDEFMVVGRNTSARAAEQLAERIRFDLAERRYDLGEGHIGRLSGSIGFAMYPFSPLRANPLSWEQVVAVADHAAYTAKKNGRNAWVGVYGTRRTKWEEFAKTHINLHTLATQGMIELRSSLPNVREFGRQPVHEEVES